MNDIQTSSIHNGVCHSEPAALHVAQDPFACCKTGNTGTQLITVMKAGVTLQHGRHANTTHSKSVFEMAMLHCTTQ